MPRAKPGWMRHGIEVLLDQEQVSLTQRLLSRQHLGVNAGVGKLLYLHTKVKSFRLFFLILNKYPHQREYHLLSLKVLLEECRHWEERTCLPVDLLTLVAFEWMLRPMRKQEQEILLN